VQIQDFFRNILALQSIVARAQCVDVLGERRVAATS
jgi:hypothetical protein